ncbi:hypothetical protein [Microbacterium sp. NPDC086615]|uniref:hypothetical protein n=1 Tax=Microbacterium sp. NPDC086615 TaxID=3154865 RepID=UPI003442479B
MNDDSSAIEWPSDDEHDGLEAALIARGWEPQASGVLRIDMPLGSEEEWPVWVELSGDGALLISPLVLDQEGILLDWYQQKLSKVTDGAFHLQTRRDVICVTRRVESPDATALILTAYAHGLPDLLLGEHVEDRIFLAGWSPIPFEE